MTLNDMVTQIRTGSNPELNKLAEEYLRLGYDMGFRDGLRETVRAMQQTGEMIREAQRETKS